MLNAWWPSLALKTQWVFSLCRSLLSPFYCWKKSGKSLVGQRKRWGSLSSNRSVVKRSPLFWLYKQLVLEEIGNKRALFVSQRRTLQSWNWAPYVLWVAKKWKIPISPPLLLVLPPNYSGVDPWTHRRACDPHLRNPRSLERKICSSFFLVKKKTCSCFCSDFLTLVLFFGQ